MLLCLLLFMRFFGFLGFVGLFSFQHLLLPFRLRRLQQVRLGNILVLSRRLVFLGPPFSFRFLHSWWGRGSDDVRVVQHGEVECADSETEVEVEDGAHYQDHCEQDDAPFHPVPLDEGQVGLRQLDEGVRALVHKHEDDEEGHGQREHDDGGHRADDRVEAPKGELVPL